jgi:hypothetical protein
MDNHERALKQFKSLNWEKFIELLKVEIKHFLKYDVLNIPINIVFWVFYIIISFKYVIFALIVVLYIPFTIVYRFSITTICLYAVFINKLNIQDEEKYNKYAMGPIIIGAVLYDIYYAFDGYFYKHSIYKHKK